MWFGGTGYVGLNFLLGLGFRVVGLLSLVDFGMGFLARPIRAGVWMSGMCC